MKLKMTVMVIKMNMMKLMTVMMMIIKISTMKLMIKMMMMILVMKFLKTMTTMTMRSHNIKNHPFKQEKTSHLSRARNVAAPKEKNLNR